ncbi:hypothetical protein [Vibrio quintilis]|uniref:3-oxoacyl-(Acyl carrier protein) synthase n=1 Tax=Vibrio quintilis TaxID=1117707 RepID=A0A1M7YVZ3_9VIBR|nr:hypothetical protein [Vibrio quintilis]SHO56849.1 3-oxoacyl-(acyl carrier protein) synthase [Vibrio quintilis]
MNPKIQSISISQSSPLTVLDIGFVSPLATGWKETCAAIKAGYDAFVYPHNSAYSSIYPIARVPFDETIRGFTRLAHLLRLAQENLDKKYGSMPVLLAMPETSRGGLISETATHDALFDAIATLPAFHGKFLRDQITCFYQGRTSFAHQLHKAHEILLTGDYEQVMIMSVDSLLFPQTLNAMLADHWDCDPILNKQRLLTNDNGDEHTDGFIPAEAAGIVVVGLAENHSPAIQIDGIGFGDEPAPLLSKNICKGDGLAKAIRTACSQAGHSLKDYPVRIASVSGEQYFFQEATLAQERNISTKTAHQPLWHPASGIGETGAAVGISMLAMAIDSFQQGYAPGDKAICHLSSDNSDRAAFTLTYKH